ncbi:DUF3102 domain-containing protein [Clostridium sp. CX1]|nr:DUF3102 domain-containing protein [Clostridium sp. CX1]MCT8975519.1 DUF3102 domain-containing protein [Clostridium sp. CX1]
MSEIIKSGLNPITRTPDLIAAEINNIKEQTRKMVLYNSIEIGRRLVEAKEIVGHGEWGKWLKESVDYSQRTANNLMRIFNEYGSEQITLLGDNSKSQAFATLSYSQAIALLEIPEKEREEFVKENNVEDMSTRELQKVIKEKQELEDKLKAAEKKAELEHKAWETVSESYNKLEKSNEKYSKNVEKLRKELEELKDKNKDELTNREVEIENLRTHINEINEQLAKAQASGNNEGVEKLQASLYEAEYKLLDASDKIQQLEKQLKEKPIEVVTSPEIIEKIPEEVEKELQELREKVASNSQPVVKFSVYFNELVENFKSLLGTLSEIEEDEVKEKYKKAVTGVIEKMAEKL